MFSGDCQWCFCTSKVVVHRVSSLVFAAIIGLCCTYALIFYLRVDVASMGPNAVAYQYPNYSSQHRRGNRIEICHEHGRVGREGRSILARDFRFFTLMEYIDCRLIRWCEWGTYSYLDDYLIEEPQPQENPPPIYKFQISY